MQASLPLSRLSSPVSPVKLSSRHSVKLSHGFTLVELMIVIAIIWVLAATLFPKISGYMAKARDTEMVVEFKKIQGALIRYNMDHGNYPIQRFADAVEYWSSYSRNSTWLQPLRDEWYYESSIKPEINADSGPWCWAGTGTTNHIYVYVSNGSHYLLCWWFESPTDGRRLENNDQRNLVIFSGSLGDAAYRPWMLPYFQDDTFKNMGWWSYNSYIFQQ